MAQVFMGIMAQCLWAFTLINKHDFRSDYCRAFSQSECVSGAHRLGSSVAGRRPFPSINLAELSPTEVDEYSKMILASPAFTKAAPTHRASPAFTKAAPTHRYSKRSEQPFCCVTLSGADRVSNLKAGEPTSTDLHRRGCICFDLHKEIIPYKEAWSWQKSLVKRRHTLMEQDEDQPDMLIILQHPPVYTLGTSSLNKYLKFNINDAPYDVYRTERGGEVTYHGPGQLVLYPIINLRYHKMDLHWYLRSLEEVVIRVLSSTFSIKASRLEGFTGVWVGNQKIAAIGIRVSRWITFHGLALNVNPDLTPFQFIVPCGIRDREVGSISGLLVGGSNGETFEDTTIHNDSSQLMDIAHESLVKEFSEVFQLSLHQKSHSDLEFYIEGNGI